MLHIVNQSPNNSTTLDSCLRIAKPGHAVLLIEDGVYAACGNAAQWAKDRDLRICALKPDLDARGMTERVAEGFELVDYAGFVSLVAEYPTSHSWL